MTSRERTGEVVKAYFGKNWNEVNEPSGTFLYDLIANAIDAAVAEAVAAEREACAKVADERRDFYRECGNASRVDEDTRVIDAIRARGGK
jgi:hypothetical protein